MPLSAPSSTVRILIAATQSEMRAAMVKRMESLPCCKIIGFVRESKHLLQRTSISRPDVLAVHADLLETVPASWLKDLRKQHPELQVLVCGRDRRAIIIAGVMREPNVCFLNPQETEESEEKLGAFLAEMTQAIASVGTVATVTAPARNPQQTLSAASMPRARRKGAIQGVVIGVSTGGPEALTSLFRGIPQDFPVPIAIVQHMPPMFTAMLADRLNRICPLHVTESEAGMPFVPGQVVLARGGSHMRLRGPAGKPSIQLDGGDPVNSCRPAVDVLFASAAEVFGGNVITVVLTGMGKDGLAGAERLHALGSPILVQDAATSTVWGMPGAIAQAGFATAILPLAEVVPEIMRYL